MLVFTPYALSAASVQRIQDSLRRIVRQMEGSTRRFTFGEEANRRVAPSERSEKFWHLVYRHEIIADGEVVESKTINEINIRPRFGKTVEKIPIGQRVMARISARLFGAFQ